MVLSSDGSSGGRSSSSNSRCGIELLLLMWLAVGDWLLCRNVLRFADENELLDEQLDETESSLFIDEFIRSVASFEFWPPPLPLDPLPPIFTSFQF